MQVVVQRSQEVIVGSIEVPEVRGRIDNLPVVYLHTTIEGAEHYYQVVAWTSAENYPSAKGELQTVIGSFRGS